MTELYACPHCGEEIDFEERRRHGAEVHAVARTAVTTIDSWDEVPAFAFEAEEAAYWQTHGPSETLLETFRPIAEIGRA